MMNLKYEFIKESEKELSDAVDYYNERFQGLGIEFANEVYKVVKEIIQFPDSGPKLSRRARKSRCKRFPYNIIYFQRYDTIIIAIMHTKRKPNYWKKRLT